MVFPGKIHLNHFIVGNLISHCSMKSRVNMNAPTTVFDSNTLPVSATDVSRFSESLKILKIHFFLDLCWISGCIV